MCKLLSGSARTGGNVLNNELASNPKLSAADQKTVEQRNAETALAQ